MLLSLRRYLVAAVLAFGVMLGVAPTHASASQVSPSLVQPAQYYGPGPGYYRGPPRGHYGRPYYGPRGYGYGLRPGFYGRGRGFHGPHRGFYGRPHYGRRFYR
ncbi:MAG: hypothetical protein EOO77_25340 [Oxalobacteraceae bacterium]|nr:MAG: hypothetical protein EOO77_25340 [Oxalobacteraceae bacterium]